MSSEVPAVVVWLALTGAGLLGFWSGYVTGRAEERIDRRVDEVKEYCRSIQQRAQRVQEEVRDASSDPETIVVAFTPTNADHATDGHHWTIYTPDREDRLDVPMGDQKLHDAIDEFDPEDYPPRDDAWSRLDWHSIMDGDPKRVDREGDHVE